MDVTLDTRSLVGSEAVVSWTQNAEDVRLLRVFRSVTDGFYVDVGAGHPSAGSVTRLFYDRGWSGINVEPGPEYASLVRERPRDVNLDVAVGEADGTASFFVTYPDPSLSTLDLAAHKDVPNAFERHEEVSVRQLRLETILRDHACGRTIHFLKIDVEGAERHVLESCDWHDFRPIVVLVEAVESWSTSPTHERWEELLDDAGYEFAAFDGVNRFYVESNHRELIPMLAYPISALDRFVPAGLHAHGQAETVTAENDRLRVENARLREELAAVYRSTTWRAGRTAAVLGRPVMAVARRARRRSSPRATTSRVAADDVPSSPARLRPTRRRSPLAPLLRELESVPRLDAATARHLQTAIAELGWTDDRSLAARRFSRAERSALVELDAVSRALARDGAPALPVRATRHVALVADARCLQDPVASPPRTLALAREALSAAREATRGMELVILASADLPDLAAADAALGDSVSHSPLESAAGAVVFLSLAPLAVSAAPSSLFLRREGCRSLAILDEVDAPGTSAADAISRRARLESLRLYDTVLRHRKRVQEPDAWRGDVAAALRRELSQVRPQRRQRVSGARPRVAVVTPFPPQASGVADYTAFTFREVAKHVDVDVYTGIARGRRAARIRELSSAPYLDSRYDRVVGVVGNSYYHLPVLELLDAFGGACIAHDVDMLDVYGWDGPDAWPKRAHSGSGYGLLARQASPLVVHGRALAADIEAETGVAPAVVPLVPHRIPSEQRLDSTSRARACSALGLDEQTFQLATFGLADLRTKATEIVLGALASLRRSGRDARLHVVGDVPPGELQALRGVAARLGLRREVTFHGRVTEEHLGLFLRAVDVAVQIRRESRLTLSGTVAECIAFGVPTVTTEELTTELEAPSYVAPVPAAASAEDVARAVERLLGRRRDSPSTIEEERRDYLAERSVGRYAAGLLEALDV